VSHVCLAGILHPGGQSRPPSADGLGCHDLVSFRGLEARQRHEIMKSEKSRASSGGDRGATRAAARDIARLA
jgi:hypothetical protein